MLNVHFKIVDTLRTHVNPTEFQSHSQPWVTFGDAVCKIKITTFSARDIYLFILFYFILCLFFVNFPFSVGFYVFCVRCSLLFFSILHFSCNVFSRLTFPMTKISTYFHIQPFILIRRTCIVLFTKRKTKWSHSKLTLHQFLPIYLPSIKPCIVYLNKILWYSK